MPDMVAIISRAVYERDLIDSRVGDVVPLAVYLSTNAALQRLATGGRLFLVTIRPPKETLWLVAVLEKPTFDGTRWNSPVNVTPIRDISSLRADLKFESGKGLPSESGKLGMSLQTPRVLTPADVELLVPSIKRVPAPKRASPVRRADDESLPLLNEHEPKGPAPCLCKTCLPSAPESFEFKGERFVRRSTSARGRRLAFWVPEELADVKDVERSVASRMNSKLRTRPGWKKPAPAKAQPLPPTIRRPESVPATQRPAVTPAESAPPVPPQPPPGGLGAWLKKVFRPK